MILGDKNRFAIEYELDEKPCGWWLYGRCCFWGNGRKIGNYDILTSLGDVFTQMHQVVKECGKRQSDWIDRDIQDIFNYFNNIIYLGCETNKEDNIEIPARYEIDMCTEPFYGVKIFLLDCGILTSRLIYSEDNGKTIREVKLVPGEFDYIIKRFYLELERLDREVMENLESKIVNFGNNFRNRIDSVYLDKLLDCANHQEYKWAFLDICAHVYENNFSITKEEFDNAMEIADLADYPLDSYPFKYLASIVNK